MNGKKFCVYTVLIGNYEALNEQPVALLADVPFICLTDDPNLKSKTWQIRQISPFFPMDSIRSQRDIKIRPHLYLPEFDGSLYIDNSVILKKAFYSLLESLDPNIGFSLPRHTYRQCVQDEFLEVSRLGMDDPVRIFEQLNHYMLTCSGVMDEVPYWTALLLRNHRDERVVKVLELWTSHVQRYSRRDQLSVNYALRMLDLVPQEMCLGNDNYNSEFHSWPHHQNRSNASFIFNGADVLIPPTARVRELEKEVARLNKTSPSFLKKMIYSKLNRFIARLCEPHGGLLK